MSMWASTCVLVAQKTERDSRGVPNTKDDRVKVPCNVFSMSASAYYAASAAGIKPQAVIEIRACAYSDQQLVEFEGDTLAVEHVQRSADNVRLTLVERVSNRGR